MMTGAAGVVRLIDMIFPGDTNHHGTLFGGLTLRMLGKAAFIAATRHARAVMVMAASDRIDFKAPIDEGEMVELIARVDMTGRSSVRVQVQLWSENLLTGERRLAASAEFVMAAVNTQGRSRPIGE
jgi:acyl-CoA hydrolase